MQFHLYIMYIFIYLVTNLTHYYREKVVMGFMKVKS